MEPVINKAMVEAEKKRTRRDSAYFIFDRGAMVPFRVSVAHHKMKHGGIDDPILGARREDEEYNARQLISVAAPVMQLVDYFIEGATLDISYETMVEVYQRIENHINAHMKAMRTSTNYYIGDTFHVFEHLVEFACQIYPRIREEKESRLATSDDPMTAMLSGRANFLTMIAKEKELQNEEKSDTPDAIVSPLKEKLERMQIHYESSHSWRHQ